MKFTKHAKIRMGQRGIPRWMIEFVREHGRVDGDAVVLDRRSATRLLDQIDQMRRQTLKVIDKGGVAVVESGATVITAYNVTGRKYHG